MAERPTGWDVICPECNTRTIAIIPKNGEVVKSEENSDGKVKVNCTECGERFLVPYRIDS